MCAAQEKVESSQAEFTPLDDEPLDDIYAPRSFFTTPNPSMVCTGSLCAIVGGISNAPLYAVVWFGLQLAHPVFRSVPTFILFI
jgi:hypothetical protein